MSKKKKAWAEDVFENWGGYMAAKRAKLEEQFHEEAQFEFQDASSLFKGVAIFVNGYTDPTSDELRRLMMKYGGIYHHYLRPQQTTHMIATNLPYSKIVMYMKSKNPLPLCKPSWITDSIEARKLLDFRKYLLYSQCTKTQPHLLNMFKPKISHQGNANDNTESRKTSFLQKEEIQLSKVLDKNCIVSESSAVPSTSKMNDFSTDKPPTREKSELSNNSFSEKNPSEISKFPIDKESPTKKKSSYSNCSKNSDFISEFYNNSRLHHIATMGATFKDYINELRNKNNKNFPGLDRLIVESKFNRPGPSTKNDSDSDEDIFAIDPSPNEMIQGSVIMHIDMDCFFVSVGIRNRPELKGLPVGVTHAKGNKPPSTTDRNEDGSYSEIASCSYEARKAGVKNGMFLGQALKLCPNLRTIKYDFDGYKEVSYALYDTLATYTLDIEAVSCDEMYVDCSEILRKSGITPLEFADIIRKEIRKKTGCPVSTGFGSNKLQARLATKKAKPDGKFHLKDGDVLNYFGSLNVKDLPGVGYSTTSKLSAMNVRTCAELQTIGLPTLQKEFGKKTGEFLYNTCRGIDNSKLSVEHVRKSISAEVNYGIRFENKFDAEEFLKKLSAEVCTRLKKANAKGRCITLKLMVRAKEAPKETVKFMGHGICDNLTRSKNFIASIDELPIITKEILILWSQMQQAPEDIRGIGIQISRLDIEKTKSNTLGLMNFINKAKETNVEKKSEQPTKPNEDFDEKKNTDIRNFKSSHKETSNLQDKAFFSNDKLILPSQDIDESVLEELPEDIRNEIISCKNIKSKKKSSQGSTRSIQTKQESYFREKKPIARGKATLPPIQDIDMAVLVELPEDIRNEILNEYKKNPLNENTFNNPSNSSSEKTESKTNRMPDPNLNHLKNEKDVSFSQVDPDFLAALPKDMRDDVQMYCMAKKQERSNANKKKTVSTKPDGVSEGWSMFKQSKCSKTTKSKSVRGRNAKCKNSGVATRVKEAERGKNRLEAIEKAQKEAEERAKANEIEEITDIISHFRSFPVKEIQSREQEKPLITLVKYMFGLSVDQIRVQIQNWVSNLETVNEIDILSIATYLSMLPKKKMIEDLHILMKCMHRCITKSGNCVWHETYRKIMQHVQHYMQIEYNSDLMVPSIECNLHECRGDDVL